MKKLTPAEQKKISLLVEEKNQNLNALAEVALAKELEIRKANLMIQKANQEFEKVLKNAQKKEEIINEKTKSLVLEFNEKYGDKLYNPETGEITEKPSEEKK